MPPIEQLESLCLPALIAQHEFLIGGRVHGSSLSVSPRREKRRAGSRDGST
jgi:hypothetical protein